jgi:hypothetical protein
MGRKSYKHKNLPKNMRIRVRGAKIYYYYDAGGKPRKEITLGKNYIEAMKKLADLEGKNQSPLINFVDVVERYKREIIPTKSQRTQSDNLQEFKELLKFFNSPPAPITEIKPFHIR